LPTKLPELSDAGLPQFLAESVTPTVLVFHSPASKPSRTVIPVVEEVSRKYEGILRIGLVNTQVASDALDAYGILSLPTFLFFRNAKMTDRFIGHLTHEKLEEKFEENLRRV
jgi:thioredoxin 1